MPQKLLSIKIQDLHPDPDQPRLDFHGKPSKETTDALASLAGNIAQFGVLEPLLVREVPGEAGYAIVAGERRWRASKLAGLSVVPCLLQKEGDSDDEQVRLIKQLSENIQREGLSPLDIAKSLKKSLETFKVTQRNLAKALGKHESWVSRHLQMLVAEGAAKEALASGLIDGYTTFNVMMSLPEEKQQQILDEAKERGDAKIPKSVLNAAAREMARPAAPAGHYLTPIDIEGTGLPTPTVDWEAPGQVFDDTFADFTAAPARVSRLTGTEKAELEAKSFDVHLETRLHINQARRLLQLLKAEVPLDEFFTIPALIEAMRNLPKD